MGFACVFRALNAPGWMKKWHCGVRASATGKLVAFISAIPSTIRVYDKVNVLDFVAKVWNFFPSFSSAPLHFEKFSSDTGFQFVSDVFF